MSCNLSNKSGADFSVRFRQIFNALHRRKTSSFPEKQPFSIVIASPLSGIVRPLEQIDDPVFSSEALGKGCAIEPFQGEVLAPFDAAVVQVAPTGHAIALAGKNGVELLVHIGMETIELDGQYFEPMVQPGDAVRQGQCLLKFDMRSISAAGYSLTTPVIVANTDDFRDVQLSSGGKITAGRDLLALYPAKEL